MEIWTRQGETGWGAVTLGMTLEEIRNVPSIRVSLHDVPDVGHCGSSSADVFNGEHQATVIFSSTGARVLLVFVPVQAECSRTRLLEGLKVQLPGLRYTPSRHDPGLRETDNRKPFYLFDTLKEVGLLVGPGVGVWLGYESCFD
jgi:hypothetical protein